MAKIAIKSEKLMPFVWNFPIMTHFNHKLEYPIRRMQAIAMTSIRRKNSMPCLWNPCLLPGN